ncbi:MAG: MFS transporter, partial [Bifidobacteriaceae bacterium]|nr:MFS transporter [Bifidobacteriaceae bacterium]
MTTTTSKGPHRAWAILVACCALQAGALGILSNSAGIFLAPVSTDLGVGRGDLAIYMTIFAVAMTAGMPLAGRLLPRIDMRLILTVAYLFTVGPFALMSQFNAVYQWYIAAVVMGVAAAFVLLMPAPLMINNWFVAKKGLAMGIAMACSGLGGAIMGPVGTSFISGMGWRRAYLMMALISAVVVLPFSIFVVRLTPACVGLKAYGAKEAEGGAGASVGSVGSVG